MSVLFLFQFPQVECYLYTPFNKKYRFGCFYVSQNFVCFQSHVTRLVSLVIPLHDVALVTKVNALPEVPEDEATSIEDGISITMKQGQKCFVFAQVPDRDFVVEKLAEMLSKLKVF